MAGPVTTPQPLAPGEKGVPLSPVDIAWLRMDDPTNLMHIHGVLALDGELTRDELARRLGERMVPIPRFRQRVGVDRGRLAWVDDAEFDLYRHVTEETLPAPGGDAELAQAIAAHLERPFDRRHPLWEFRLFQGHRDGAVVFARIHHAIGDGVALMVVLLAQTDLSPGGPPTVEAGESLESAALNPFLEILQRPRQGLERARRIAEELMPETMRLMEAPAAAIARLNPVIKGAGMTAALGRLVGRPSDPRTPFKGKLQRAKRVAWSENIPLDDVRAIGRSLGGTINDVLNSAMAGGLRRYMARDGEPAENLAFRCAMPVSLRPLEEMADLGNRFGLLFLSLPVGIRDPERRLAEMRRRAASLKRSAEPIVAFAILRAIGILPEAVHRMVVRIFATKATAVFTNVPGPRATLYFGEHAIRDIFFWVPQAARLGLGVSILSYDGKVRMGVGTDAGLVPDPERILEGFVAELDALATRASRV